MAPRTHGSTEVQPGRRHGSAWRFARLRFAALVERYLFAFLAFRFSFSVF